MRLPTSHLGSIDPDDYVATDLGAYRGCFAANLVFDRIPGTTLTVTFLGTTSLLFDDGRSQILIDGFISRPAVENLVFKNIGTNEDEVRRVLSAVGARRVAGVFVAHAHYDHALDFARPGGRASRG